MLPTVMAIAPDGTDVRGYLDGPSDPSDDPGVGTRPVVLIVGPGLDDGRRTARLARALAPRFRTIRLVRRQYRLDLDSKHPEAFTVGEEVEDVLAVARAVGAGADADADAEADADADAGAPVILYGHSSGGTIALEALVASAASASSDLFAGAVIFEPASIIDTAWTGTDGDALTRARVALSARKVGRAIAIFTRDVTGYSALQAWVVGLLTAVIPRYRALVGSQLDDLKAMDDLGPRLEAYARNTVPTILLGGDHGPERNAAVLDALARAMPRTERVVLPGRDHGADLKAPREVAAVIADLADRVLSGRPRSAG